MENNYNNGINVSQEYATQKPKKKKTGVIAGIIIVVVGVITTAFFLANGKSEFVGTWTCTEGNETVEFTLKDDGSAVTCYSKNNKSQSKFASSWSYNEDTKYLTVTIDKDAKGKISSISYEVVSIDDKVMILKSGELMATFAKIAEANSMNAKLEFTEVD